MARFPRDWWHTWGRRWQYLCAMSLQCTVVYNCARLHTVPPALCINFFLSSPHSLTPKPSGCGTRRNSQRPNHLSFKNGIEILSLNRIFRAQIVIAKWNILQSVLPQSHWNFLNQIKCSTQPLESKLVHWQKDKQRLFCATFWIIGIYWSFLR